jgi:mono/diheme cytochrome c family protein
MEVEGVTRRPQFILPALLLGLCLLPGCTEDTYSDNLRYEFTPYPSTKDGQKVELTLDAAQKQQVADLLEPHFGTPRAPKVYLGAGGSEESGVAGMQLDDTTLTKGSKLYRQHCLHCHGLPGNGLGSTGQFLSPLPRDFRQGKFKFRSTAKRDASGKPDTSAVTPPSREDLMKTLRSGIPTASMPSFHLLPDDELSALTSYVIHLSLRGQAENTLARQIAAGESADPAATVASNFNKWVRDSKTYDPAIPANWHDIVRGDGKQGRELYLGDGGCVQCHGKDGVSSPAEVADNATRRNDWGDLNPPRDLTVGAYRGGSRPIDLFWRIRIGIGPAGMPAASEKLTDEQVWHLVDYTMKLPAQRR